MKEWKLIKDILLQIYLLTTFTESEGKGPLTNKIRVKSGSKISPSKTSIISVQGTDRTMCKITVNKIKQVPNFYYLGYKMFYC